MANEPGEPRIDLRYSQGVLIGDHGRMRNTFRLSLGFRRAEEPGRLTPHQRKQMRRALQGLAAALERNDIQLLETSLAPMSLPFNLTERPALVANPNRVRSRPADRPLPPGIPVEMMFRSFSERMLVVGGIGAGKSTALVMLARALWLAATVPGPQVRQVVDGARVPAIFRLSRWTDDGPTLAQWLTAELTDVYGIERRVASMLIANGLVIPLLDGLDEVTEDRRDQCVRELNAFSDESGSPPPLVVTCRSGDYDTAVRLAGAVQIEGLADWQVLDHLTERQPELRSLLDAYHHDAELRRMLRTPLFLHQAVVAAQARPGAVLGVGEIVSTYVDSLFGQRTVEGRADRPRYPDPALRRWLSRLAAHLRDSGQTVFVPDRLDSAVLATPGHRAWLDKALPVLLGVVIGACVAIGVLTSVTPPWSIALYSFSAAIGAAAGLAVGRGCRRTDPVGMRLAWDWSEALVWLRDPALVAGWGTGVAAVVAVHLLTAGTVGFLPVILLLSGLLATGRGLRTTAGGEAPAPDSELRVSRRNAQLVWALAVACTGVVSGVIVATNAVVFGHSAEAWLVGMDATFIVWTQGTLLAGAITGLAVVCAPKRGRPASRHAAASSPAAAPPRSVPAVTLLAMVLAVPAALLLDLVLYRLLVPLRMPDWLSSVVVIALVLLLSWMAAWVNTRRPAVVSRPIGALLAAYSMILIVRLLAPDPVRNSTMYLVVTLVLAIGAALALRGGGLAWMRQQVIRALLGREGTMPRDLLAFLDDAENRGLLHRVNGGYIFPHEVVLAHFAPRDAPRNP